MNHLSEAGDPRMVNIGGKAATARRAVAEGRLLLKPEHERALDENPKGDPLGVAQIAGILAAKKCPDLIPLCHSLPLASIEVRIERLAGELRIVAEASANAATGVEMEAYVAVAIAGTTLIDMLKGASPDLELTGIRLLEKTGGKTLWKRE